jgi:Cu(I)/Ag(I) efflux system membrane fusion protein
MQISKIDSLFTGSLLVFSFMMISCTQKAEKSEPVQIEASKRLKLSDAQIQLANIQVAPVIEGTIGKNLLLRGVLKVNEQSIVSVSSRANGRINKLFVKTTGEMVSAGDSLYTIYSEDLIFAEREFYNIQRSNWNNTGQYPPSLILEDRLLFLGMAPAQIAQLKKDGKILFEITILSQVSGVVRSVEVTEGRSVEPGEKLFELVTGNTLWVEAESYPGELNSISEGMNASVIIPSARGKEIHTRISYVNPVFEPGRNITRVRAVLNNQQKDLYPGMLALLSISTRETTGTIIPASAVLSEKDVSKVWILDEEGYFSGRNVKTGIQSGDSVLILSGLDGVKYVVTSGSYLLNSENILKNGIGSESGSESEM